MKTHPPKVPLVVRMGVVGHKLEELAEKDLDEAALRASIRRVFARVRRSSESLRRQNFDMFKSVGPTFRIVSSLDTGSQQFAAEEGLSLAFELEAPLPVARNACRESFPNSAAKQAFDFLLGRARRILELDGPSASDNSALEATGRVILRQSDVLIAIWDGAASSRRGDTGQFVKEALFRKIPVIWIQSSRPHRVSLLLRLSDEGTAASSCTLDAFPPMPESQSMCNPPHATIFDRRLQDILALPSWEEVDRLARFRLERQRRWRWAVVYSAFCKSVAWPRPKAHEAETLESEALDSNGLASEEAEPEEGQPKQVAKRSLARHLIETLKRPLEILGRDVPDWEKLDEDEWLAPWNSTEQLNPSAGKQSELQFRRAFTWADGIAGLYGDRYRGLFIINYLLGAFAVLAAFLGSHSSDLPSWITLVNDSHDWFICELILIFGILLLVLFNWLGRWQACWIDYRLLAEGLRQMRVLSPLARVTPSFEVPAHLDEDHYGPSWFNWYFRAITREGGLTQARIDRDYLTVCRRILRREVKRQVDYHKGNEEKLERIHLRLHLLSIVLFAVTIVACFLHLGLNQRFETFLGGKTKGILTLVAIVFPAFGAAIQGILHQGEFGRLSRRSHSIRIRLGELLKKIDQDESMSFRDLGRTAELFCEIQLSEQADWRSVFLSKEVSL
jgi:hypothetical protein